MGQLVNIFVSHPHLNIDHIAKALTIGIEENEIKAIKNNYDLLKKMKEKNIKNEENDINFEFEGKLSHFQRAVKVHKISQKEVNSFSYENPRIDYDATAKALNIGFTIKDLEYFLKINSKIDLSNLVECKKETITID